MSPFLKPPLNFKNVKLDKPPIVVGIVASVSEKMSFLSEHPRLKDCKFFRLPIEDGMERIGVQRTLNSLRPCSPPIELGIVSPLT
jgi:hypothetical protein